MKYAIPVAFARYIIIDNAAPVAPLAIYVPSYEGVDWNNLTTILSVVSLEGPSAFRAMGSVDSVNSTTLAKSFVSIDQPEILTKDPISGDPNQRMTYRYVVTGIDFGLQKYPDLILNVEGSCETEYGWYNGTKKSSDSTAPLDVYYLFNNASYEEWVSLDDGPSPVANFVLGPRPGLLSNFTWAAVISSVNRTSCSTGTDPWYLTVPNAPGTFSVKPGRPALSCWQNDVWSFRGVNSSVTELTAPALPGLDLPESLQDIFARNLANPKIPALGMRLGASALKSATNAFSGVFNASSSSVYADLERLVFASYIATVNTLTETTLFAPNSGIKNDALDDNGQPQPGVEEFVIWSKDVITLSVKALIIIPVLAGLLWMIFFGVLLLPIPEIVSLSLPAEKGPNGNPAEVDEEENGESGEESTTEKVIGSALEEVVLLGTQSTSTSFS
ncbi:hypothetical protein MMC13_005537 [Lambiella insularis]|nr:hypothetical protein [Lambiella insularis]